MAQQSSTSSSSASSSGFEISAAADASWAVVADGLPETVTINGVEYKSADLNDKARNCCRSTSPIRKLLAIEGARGTG